MLIRNFTVGIQARKPHNPKFLFHDSSVFADVDERQIASAIKLAKATSEEHGFQYICCLNSDKVPTNLLEPELMVSDYVRLELKDKPDGACLFGFRF